MHKALSGWEDEPANSKGTWVLPTYCVFNYCNAICMVWYGLCELFNGYAPLIRLKMAISGRHAHIHADKTYISR